MKRLLGGLKRAWVPLVLVVTVTLSGVVMTRMHSVFGTHRSIDASGEGVDEIVQFNLKRVVYELFGPEGTSGYLSYLDADAQPHQAEFTSLPWSFEVTTTLPTMFANVVAQGDSQTLGCRITVDGEVRDTQSTDGNDAQVFCLVKAA